MGTKLNIKAQGAFTVSIADAAHMVEADYFGVESGNRVTDKFARSGLTASKAETVDAPVINEFPHLSGMSVHRVSGRGIWLWRHRQGGQRHRGIMMNGRIDMARVQAIAFDPYTHGYYKVTERVGEAFKDGLKLKK